MTSCPPPSHTHTTTTTTFDRHDAIHVCPPRALACMLSLLTLCLSPTPACRAARACAGAELVALIESHGLTAVEDASLAGLSKEQDFMPLLKEVLGQVSGRGAVGP